MGRRTSVIGHIQQLCELFEKNCPDAITLKELVSTCKNKSKWRSAHDLFGRIRGKILRATAQGDKIGEVQHQFEEVCAKTIYNVGRFSAPFDPEAPFWIVPHALTLAHYLGIDEKEVTKLFKE